MNVKSILYNEAYILLLPFVTENKIEKLNTNASPEVESALESLSKFIASELESTALDKAASDRNEHRCSKVRKYKTREKNEYGKHEIFTVEETRRGYNQERKRYQNVTADIENRYSELEDVLQRLENKALSEDDMQLLYYVLSKNKWNFRLQVAVISIALTVFVFGIVFSQIYR